jgi:hypothetical protein
MKRSRCRLAAGIKGVNLHLGWIVAETDGNEAGRDQLVQSTADGCSEIGLGNALQRYLSADRISIDAVEFAAIDHIAAGNRAVRPDDTCQALFELSHRTLPPRRATPIGR